MWRGTAENRRKPLNNLETKRAFHLARGLRRPFHGKLTDPEMGQEAKMEPIARIQSALPRLPRAVGQSSTAAEECINLAEHAQLAVIPIAPAEGHSRVAGHPTATFLAHLIATAAQLPQTRARRRAEPDAAAAIYACADRTSGGSTGTICTRDI